MNRFTNILNNLVELTTTSGKLYAIIIVGSHARENRHADDYSDLDVIIVVDDPDFLFHPMNGLNI